MTGHRLVLVLVSGLLLVTAAGCLSGDDPTGDDGGPRDGEGDGDDASVDNDEDYVLPLTGTTWDKTTLLVLVVPPAYGEVGDPDQVNPYDGVYLKAVEDSIAHWQRSITEHGSQEVRQIVLDTYVLGRDIPPGHFAEVDILVVNPLKPPILAPFSGVGIGLPTGHCVAYNSIEPLEDEYPWIFALSGHEFGHCLGMGHPVGHHPWEDLMSYTDIYVPDGEEEPPLECVSNMNLAALHEAFAPAFGREPQGPIEFPPAEYVIYECWDEFLPGS